MQRCPALGRCTRIGAGPNPETRVEIIDAKSGEILHKSSGRGEIENMAIKQKLFANVEKNWKPGTIVSSNTSGMSVEGMLENRSELHYLRSELQAIAAREAEALGRLHRTVLVEAGEDTEADDAGIVGPGDALAGLEEAQRSGDSARLSSQLRSRVPGRPGCPRSRPSRCAVRY